MTLSWPLALTNLAQIAMGTTDVMMMGVLGPDTVAAGALGVNLYFIAMIFGMGLLNAVPPMIARARGAGRPEQIGGIVRQGLVVSVVLAVPCSLLLWYSQPLLIAMGQDPGLAAAAGVYSRRLLWALIPVWAFIVLRGFTNALERPAWPMLICLAGVPMNAGLNWCLMLGHCGCPAMGIAGSGLASSLTSLVMVLALGLVVLVGRPFRDYHVFAGAWRIERTLLRLGLPMAATLTFEITMFNAAVFLMGVIGAAPLAAHAIAIQLVACTFMVPLGLGQAVTVRVGLAFGARDPDGVRRAGWTAFGLAVGFMALMSLAIVLAPRLLISAFLDVNDPANQEVVRLATSFLMFAALFQVADGVQAVGSGMLRGLHDARMPMVFALTGYWGIGLPLGIVLAFPAGMGGAGIWAGLSAGLLAVACLMMRRWVRRAALGLL